MTDATLPPLIQQMLLPDFYPHPVADPIQLIQTHISYVFLTGEFAYKVKKPLDFGFLNYTTLEKREFYCQAELRLNQRGAAELYLDVLAISETDGTFELGGRGQPVEYVLQMRQFPQETLLPELLDRGELTPALIRQLAQRIARFHAQLDTSDYIREFGSVANIRAAFDENYEQTERYIGGPQTREQWEATRTATDRFFADRADLLHRRVRDNKIRECHGDLHLNNICYWNNRFSLFDCIEFNEPFRFVDVMYDIAYIVMDLQVRGRSGLSALFVNEYIEQTGDYEGLQVLPLYVSRQSYVRAKVTSFLLDDPNVSADKRAEAEQTAAQYYRLACECLQPRTGRLFLMSGLSGSGKSTVARAIAQKFDAVHIRSDAVRKHLAGIPLQERGSEGDYGSGIYTPEMTAKTYDRLLELGILLAEEGYPAILDAKYDRQALRQTAIAAAREHNIPLKIVSCEAPIETIRTWLKARQGDIADATVDILERQIEAFEPLSEAEKASAVVIRTDGDMTAQLEKLS
ncbi:bifunctional aminoglycoside phosphotransferase/ATP-binding protein [Synechococcus sp. PCC 7336]|uniref:bifunctional aminoglycoside phosphotransferase/ATP-binding protein n=1 Tax=Synechococcus sp. PCC 7336 TaxID=195250 RepID=UPI0004774F35|nr:bifunctional aminoglycoside phosphotransferase/ATP-binding protein [Synechococcus sp. PCC 7336]